jgi:hypothetical protein
MRFNWLSAPQKLDYLFIVHADSFSAKAETSPFSTMGEGKWKLRCCWCQGECTIVRIYSGKVWFLSFQQSTVTARTKTAIIKSIARERRAGPYSPTQSFFREQIGVTTLFFHHWLSLAPRESTIWRKSSWIDQQMSWKTHQKWHHFDPQNVTFLWIRQSDEIWEFHQSQIGPAIRCTPVDGSATHGSSDPSLPWDSRSHQLEEGANRDRGSSPTPIKPKLHQEAINDP